MGRPHPTDLRRRFRSAILAFIYDQSLFEQKHGLRTLPTAGYPDLTEGVTLKCTKKQEAVSD